MNNFREMPLVRALLVALVFVVCFGVFGGDSAFAKYDMQNGHEGDPGDGHDIVGGGSGEGVNHDQFNLSEGKPENSVFIFSLGSNGSVILVRPIFENGILYFEFVVNPFIWGQK